MNYLVKHKTRYVYPEVVNLCHNQISLGPRNTANQTTCRHRINITPEPNFQEKRIDFFGNTVYYFSLQKPHTTLEVLVISEIEINSPSYWPLQLRNSPPWEEAVGFLKSVDCSIEVQQFQLETELTAGFPALKQFTMQSFTPGRPLLEAVQDLNSRIYHDFAFSPGFTDVSTPVEQVFIHKKGVCQDFAHLFLSCLRSLGLAARYVSGYIETLPPPGKQKLTGSDASHAWVSVYCPRYGWVDFDATNNLINDNRHLTIAWGRDFTDVIPMKGIVYSSGSQKLVVEVDVIRQKDK